MRNNVVRSVITIFPIAYVLQADDRLAALSDNLDKQYFVDKLVDNLLNRSLKVRRLHQTDLQSAILAKPHVGKIHSSASTRLPVSVPHSQITTPVSQFSVHASPTFMARSPLAAPYPTFPVLRSPLPVPWSTFRLSHSPRHVMYSYESAGISSSELLDFKPEPKDPKEEIKAIQKAAQAEIAETTEHITEHLNTITTVLGDDPAHELHTDRRLQEIVTDLKELNALAASDAPYNQRFAYFDATRIKADELFATFGRKLAKLPVLKEQTYKERLTWKMKRQAQSELREADSEAEQLFRAMEQILFPGKVLASGTGFVQFVGSKAKEAVNKSLSLDGEEVRGSTIQVSVDPSPLDKNSILIRGFPVDIKEETLKDIFQQFGKIGFVSVGRGFETGSGVVRFTGDLATEAAVNSSVALNGSMVGGNEIEAIMDVNSKNRRSVCVHNLPPEVGKEELIEMFKPWGKVAFAAIAKPKAEVFWHERMRKSRHQNATQKAGAYRDRNRPKSRKEAVIRFTGRGDAINPAAKVAALTAVEKMDRSIIRGNNITVKIDPKSIDKKTLALTGLPANTTTAELRDIFGSFGRIAFCAVSPFKKELPSERRGGGAWGALNRQKKGKPFKPFRVDKSGGDLGEFTGKIKSGGLFYGFIECPEAVSSGVYGDIFLHASERGDYVKGQTVKFTLVLNRAGKATAIDLKDPD